MKEFKVSGASEGIFCQTCGKVINKEDKLHKNHNITTFTSEQVNNVSSIIQGKTDNKKEAQYFFNKKSKNYIIDCIRNTGSSHLLCIGTPTIFDQVNNISKLLLDFDSRYLGLHRPSDFIWFNMLNFHFFHNNKIILETFVSSATHVSIVLDPPFGARPELIQNSLECLKKCLPTNVEISIFWIFPYFMEKKLQQDGVQMNMSKYRVNYTNHKEFSGDSNGRKFGSPVRIFTNVDLKCLPVPKNEDYRMCEKCEYFVSSEDVHCNICNTCPSKDGRPYSHCNICCRCVKITYTHCLQCQRCHLPVSCNSNLTDQMQSFNMDGFKQVEHIRAKKRSSESIMTGEKKSKKHKRKRKK